MNVKAFGGVYRAMAASAVLLGLSPFPLAAEDAPASSPPPPSAPAGDTPPAATDQIQDVVVHARKVSERLQEVPIPITSLSESDVELKDLTNFQDFKNELPAVSFGTSNSKQTNIGVRGIGNNGSNQDGLDPSVGVLVDGVFQPRLGVITNEYVDLSQIELLRGPQGTLFGKNTTAGVVLINTRKPGFTPSFSGEVVQGNFGTQEYKFNLNQPIVDDKLAVRLTGYHDSEDGWVTNVRDGDGYLARKSIGARLQTLYQPTDNLSIRLIGSEDYQNYHTGGNVFKQYYPAGGTTNIVQLARQNGLPYPTDDNGQKISLSQAQSTFARTAEASLHVDWETDYGTFSDITAWNHWYFLPTNPGGQPFIAYTDYGTDNNLTNESQEMRWTSPRGKSIETQAGTYFYWSSLDAHNLQTLGSQYVLANGGTASAASITQAHATGLQTQYHYSIYDSSYAIYDNTTWHATDRWDFNAGLRETWENKTWAYNGWVSANPGGATASEIAAVASGLIQPGYAAVKDVSLGSQIGTSYKITDDVLAFVTVAKGSKAKGINQNPLTAAKIAAGGTAVLQPEKATNVEIGAKTEWLNHRLRVNAAAYDELVLNYQATGVTYVPGTTQAQSYLTNVGAIRSKGLELESTIVPLHGLQVSGFASYNLATYASYHDASCAASDLVNKVCDLTGRQVPFTPRFTSDLTTQYEWTILEGLTGYGLLDLGWRSRQNLSATLDPYLNISDYFVGNIKFGVRFFEDRADLSFWIDNFTDSYYFTSLTGTKASGIVTGTTGEPLSFGSTIRVKF